MWKQIEHYLPEFPTAVLSALDPAGYPCSVRCQPRLDPNRQTLWVQVPEGAALQPGPACLLCHTHDKRLWNLKSFVVRGSLSVEDGGWAMYPREFISGMGVGGWRSYVEFVRHGRAATRDYFVRRGLPYPVVRWAELMALLTGQVG